MAEATKKEAKSVKPETESKKSENTAKDAKRVVGLEDIKFNPENKTMAILSCIPVVGLIMLFVEKKDEFVRYYAAQYATFMALFILSFIPLVNILALCLYPVTFVLMIMGMIKASNGERFDIPVVSGIALKIMNSI